MKYRVGDVFITPDCTWFIITDILAGSRRYYAILWTDGDVTHFTDSTIDGALRGKFKLARGLTALEKMIYGIDLTQIT